MNSNSKALSLTLLATSILSLAACATTPAPTRPSLEPDAIVVETKSAGDKADQRIQPKETKNEDSLSEPVVKGDPSDPASGRNQGFGPYDSLEAICGAKQERCSMSEPVALVGSKTITRMASFVEQPMDGQTSLALETKDGWFISSVPDGRAFGGGLSHHTPAGTHYYFDKARADGDGVVLLRSFSQSVFIPGQGSSGSRSFSETVRLKCAVTQGRAACGEGKPVHSRACEDADCKESGVHPAAK